MEKLHVNGNIRCDNLTTSTVLVSDINKNIASSGISLTTLGYLDATSSIQGQFNSIFTSRIQTGSAVSGNVVLFAVPYISIPIVIVSMTSTPSAGSLIYISDTGITGFTVLGLTSVGGPATINYNWIAIGN